MLGRDEFSHQQKGEAMIETDSLVSPEITKSVSALLKSFSDMASEASRQLSDAIKNLAKPIQFSEAFQGLSVELGKAFERFGISERVATKLLYKYKLFLSPSVDIRLFHDIARIAEKKGNYKAEINQLLARYFFGDSCRELAGLIRDWEKNELFRPRMKILRDCLTALRTNGNGYNPSNVVLPTLIAQIDGISQCYMEKQGYSYMVIETKKRRRMGWVDNNGTPINWKDVYVNNTKKHEYMSTACEIFVNVLFESSARGSRSLITFNRHKIMHGEYTHYGRIENTIRAFLVLDFLHYLTKES
jgi:hypothetical protein